MFNLFCSKIPHTQITIFRETKLNILLRARHKSESNLVNPANGGAKVGA